MNRDQIGEKVYEEPDILKDFFSESSESKVGKQLIDLNAEASPAVLSGVLGCNVSLVYQFRQDGKLPPNSDASYRDCVKHHIQYWKKKSISKANNMAEANLAQSIQLNRAKTEMQWLTIKKERGELVDTKLLAQVFEPFFINLRIQLISLARKHPDLQQEVDNMLSGWQKLGQQMLQKSQEELDNFIETQMNQDIELETVRDPDEDYNE